MTGVVMEARDVHARFRIGGGLSGPARTLRAVNGVSLQLRRGEILGLVGESGCGKSTLSRILLGLQSPTTGDVYLDGEPLSALARKRIASCVQPIFQDPFASLNARQTVGEIVGLPLRVHKVMSRADRRQSVKAMLDRVGIAEQMVDVFPHELSGGQRQRVAIARALILRPPIVICDEPTSALDVSVQAQILNLLMELQRELGTSYLLISHNLGIVEHIASRVAVMYAGRIVEIGETEALFRAPQHPYTQALLAAVPRVRSAKREIVDLGTTFPNPVDLPQGCTFHPRCRFAGEICRTAAPPTTATTTGAIECHLISQPDEFRLPAAVGQ